jgi:hypothetical protein
MQIAVVITTEHQTVAAGHSLDVDPAAGRQGWRSCWVGSRAASAGWEPRRRATAFVHGLLADLPRKNCWTLAEHAGDATPDRMQHLLGRRCGTTTGP